MALPEYESEKDKQDVPTPVDQASIEVANTHSMRKLKADEIKSLNLPETSSPIITSAVRNTGGEQKLVYLLRTGEGSIFELDANHPMIQEMQIKAASAAVDTFEALTPLQTANAIKKSVNEFGYTFDGGPLEAWDFAIQAMDRMLVFQKKQLQLHQINALQSATMQLQQDANLSLTGFALLPPHRKQAAVILTQLGLAAAVKEYTDVETLSAAERLKSINMLFEEMAAEKANIWAESKAERAYGAASKVKTFLGDILSQGNANTAEFSKTLLGFIFGEELQDEGIIKATLIRAGDSGTKLLELIEESGLGINGFFKNLIGKGDKKHVGQSK
jgi:hypothetical protein